MATESPEVYKVLAYRLADLEKKVKRFAGKANKLGLAPVTFEVVGEEVVPERDPHTGRKTGRVFVYKLVEIHGEAPVVEGHTFVARIEHTMVGNLISKAPGVARSIEVPTEMRDGAPTCDHCKTNRRRKDTFVLREDASDKLIRVGRNCLADFLRCKNAGDALSVWSLMHDLRGMSDEDCDESFGSVYAETSLLHFVACAFSSVEASGWVSKREAFDDESKTATATDASFIAGPCPMNPEVARAWRSAQPTEAHAAEAEAAVEWAQGLEGKTDYEHNLKTVCSLPCVGHRHEGVAASVVVAYCRYRERELARKTEAKPSDHFGTVGSRYVRKVTVTSKNSWNSEYGVTVLYTLKDTEGCVFKWFSSGGCGHPSENRNLDVGDDLFFTFAVKSHGNYKGRKETTISRATPSESEPTYKWVNPTTGEVYKTKKAMRSALGN